MQQVQQHWLLVQIIFLIAASSIQCLRTEAPASSALADLIEIRSQTNDGVIPMDQILFEKYALAKGRTYSMMFFLTADYLLDNPKLHLRELYKEFAMVATAYQKGPDPDRVFFGSIKFEESQELFRLLGVSTLPFVFHWNPEQTKRSSGMLQLTDQDRFATSGDWQAEKMAAYVAEMTGAGFAEIDRPSLTKSPTFPLLVLGFLALMASSAWRFYHSPLAQSTAFWTAGSLVVYWFSSSGGMYNIIRGMPMYILNQERKPQFFLQGRGNQLGVEGFTMGSAYLGVSLAIAALTFTVPKVKDAKARNLAGAACIVAAVLLVFKIFDLYKWKAGYWLHMYLP